MFPTGKPVAGQYSLVAEMASSSPFGENENLFITYQDLFLILTRQSE